MLKIPKHLQIIQDNNEIKKVLSSFSDEKILIIHPLFVGSQIYIALQGEQNFALVELETEKIELLNDFTAKFIGLAVFANSKETYKQYLKYQLNFPEKFADLEIGVYLEESERKVNLIEIIEAKFNIKVNFELLNVIATRIVEDDIFGEPELDLDFSGIDELTKNLYLLTDNLLNKFTSELKKLWLEIESPLAIVLATMELAGVYINKSKLRETAVILTDQSKKLEQNIFELLETNNININSPSQLAEALAKKGFNLSKKGASGKLSVDKFVLDELALEDESGVIEKILEYRTLVKLLSTYTENLIELLDEKSRLHCTFNQAEAATGRISSNSPNLQNIPIRNQEYGSIIRSCFAAPSGRMLVSADYSQVELRLLAHFTQDPVLLEAFKLNQDIHRRTASEIFEIPINEITKEQRALGKTLNFALLYQQGSFATARQLGITVKEAKQFIDKYFAAFATIKPFIEKVLEKARLDGYTESLSGRRRYFKYLNSPNKMLAKADERAAFNMVLQGSNADLIKIAMNEIDNKISEQNLDAVMILQVHDELVFDVAADQVGVVSSLVQDAMSNPPITLNVPLFVDTEHADNWSDC